jgi:CheY-like chemotaxis protein
MINDFTSMGLGVTKTIMVVDDSPDDTQLLLRTFAQLGIVNPVVTFDNADDAMAHLLDPEKTKPSLILLDLKMPRTDGLSMLAKIKAHNELRRLVVIVLTTSADIRDITMAYDLGANSFLTKPLNLDEFRTMVSAFHSYWLVQNQPLPPIAGSDLDTPRS